MNVLAGENTGAYTGNQVERKQHFIINGPELVEYYPDAELVNEKNPNGKGIIVLIMGGPNEYRPKFTGFPSCIAAHTGQVVVDVCYPGTMDNEDPRTPKQALQMMRLDYSSENEPTDYMTDTFNWHRMACQVHAAFEVLHNRGFSVDKVVCHSFGIVPLLCALAKPDFKAPFAKLVMIEPYWNIRAIETDEEFLRDAGLLESVIGPLGQESPVEGLEGPFEMFQHPMKDVLDGLGVTDVTVMFAAIESNYYTKKIQAQKDTLFTGIKSVTLPNVGHGLNMKNVVVERYVGMTLPDIEGGLMNVIKEVAAC